MKEPYRDIAGVAYICPECGESWHTFDGDRLGWMNDHRDRHGEDWPVSEFRDES